MTEGVEASPLEGTSASQWPVIVGTVGLILGVLMVLDQLDDLATLGWTAQDWARVVGPRIGAVIADYMPPSAWRITTLLVQLGLGVLLCFAGLRLRHRQQSGVRLCRMWAGLAIAWAAISLGIAAWWLLSCGSSVPGAELVNWQAWALFGIGIALVILTAFPVFLLIWFQQPGVRAEWRDWPD